MLRGTVRLVPIGDYHSHRIEWGGMAKQAQEFYELIKQKHNGYCTVELSPPHRPRTTGPKKQKPDDPGYQSNHLNGHLSQLAVHFGYTKGEMKEIMKDDVPEWPTEKRTIGKRTKIRPVSEAVVSIEVASRAIEWCHMIAGEEKLELKEE